MALTPQMKPRPRNARGEGSKLWTDIVSAAGKLLDDTGGPDAVTLRAVAREIGVAAPSLYAHFPDRDAILAAVIDAGFAELVTTIVAARDKHTEPAERLEAGVRAVLRFAADRPARFVVMLGRPGSSDPEPHRGATRPATISFQLLVDGITDCMTSGISTCSDARLAATAMMVASHGYALLKPHKPTFAWPAEDDLVSYIITALAKI